MTSNKECRILFHHMQDEEILWLENAELLQHRCLLKTGLIDKEANPKRMANRSPRFRKFLACKLAQGIAGTYKASKDAVLNALSVCIQVSRKLGRHDQMVEDRLEEGHGCRRCSKEVDETTNGRTYQTIIDVENAGTGDIV